MKLVQKGDGHGRRSYLRIWRLHLRIPRWFHDFLLGYPT